MPRDIPPISDYAHWNEDAQRVWYEENKYDMAHQDDYEYDEDGIMYHDRSFEEDDFIDPDTCSHEDTYVDTFGVWACSRCEAYLGTRQDFIAKYGD